MKLKTAVSKEKTRVSRGGNVGFQWVGGFKKNLDKSPDHKLSNELSFFKIGKVYDELHEGN